MKEAHAFRLAKGTAIPSVYECTDACFFALRAIA